MLVPYDSTFIKIWGVVDISFCLLSAYVYSWLACFGTDSDTGAPFALTVLFEIIFTISIILKMLTSYLPDGESSPVTDHKLIFTRYRDTELQRDFIAWIPIVLFVDCSKQYFYRLFYTVKVIRITKAIEKFNVGYIMSKVKINSINKIKEEIKNNPNIGDDTVTDHNRIEYIMKIGYGLKIFKLVVVILNTSYFVGIMFMIMADFSRSVAYELGDTD